MSFMTCCVSNCLSRLTDGIPLHRFPNPESDQERFQEWITNIGGETRTLDPSYIFKNRRVCHQHFDPVFYGSKNRLNKMAIPTLRLTDRVLSPCNPESTSATPIAAVTPVVIMNFALDNILCKQPDRGLSPCNNAGTSTIPMAAETPVAIMNVAQENNLCKPQDVDKVKNCIICLRTYEDINVFNSESTLKEVTEKIYICFKIVVSFGHCLTSRICRNCMETLNTANEFRLKCLSFEKRFLVHSELHLNKPIEDPKIEIDSLQGTEENNLSNDNGPSDSEELVVKSVDFKCSICNKILKSMESLLRHKVSMHQKRKHLGKVTGCGETRRYHCTKCSYFTPHSQTLVNHMRRHNGERPYHCECGKSFTQCSSLAAHQKTHSNTTYYTCATCGKQFKHAFTLKKHLQVHEPGKYSCDICHKTLKSAQTLQDHKHRHFNIKNYNCEDCGNTFVTCSELLNHKKKHSSVKQIGCHLCTYKTHTKKNLIIHLKRHTGDKSIKCGLCELSFYTSGDLRRHHRVHTREKPFACPTCAQRFTHSTSLNKHIHNVHGLDYKWEDFKLKELKRNKNVQVKFLMLDNK